MNGPNDVIFWQFILIMLYFISVKAFICLNSSKWLKENQKTSRPPYDRLLSLTKEAMIDIKNNREKLSHITVVCCVGCLNFYSSRNLNLLYGVWLHG